MAYRSHSALVALTLAAIAFMSVACTVVGKDSIESNPANQARPSDGLTPSSISSARRYKADIDFAQGAISHLGHAVAMSDMAANRPGSSDQVKQLARQITSEYGTHIEKMSGWLSAWDQPVPALNRSWSSTSPSVGSSPQSQLGSPQELELAQLENRPDGVFDATFLRLAMMDLEVVSNLISDEKKNGAYDPAKEMASTIERSQEAENSKISELLSATSSAKPK